MKTYESILPTLHTLFIEQLPSYIEKINKEKNDGIILPPLQNKTLFENCQKLPCFKFTFDKAEYLEKDRIIQNTVFDISIEIKTGKSGDADLICFYRYVDAINKMLNEFETPVDVMEKEILQIKENLIILRFIVE